MPIGMYRLGLEDVTRYAFLIAYVLSTSSLCAAQTNTFFWGFTEDSNPNLQTCVTYSLGIEPDANNISGSSTPPYYLIAYELGGVTTVTPVGSTSLSWQVTHRPGAFSPNRFLSSLISRIAIGAQLMLTMADANGNAGGVDRYIRTVAPGSSSTCQMPTPDPSFVMTANATGTLQTCQPWGLSIQGGTPPYGVTVARLNTSVVTNMTVPLGDDIVTYINTAEPLGVILAAVHDSYVYIVLNMVNILNVPITWLVRVDGASGLRS
ncbi:hypothetical protein JAAARDRAFT_469889 [Jaapia argillacea MUCL 33604]|uniref:Uncharacterized protein n=1 Tax=Jaapia argillacea MUCL 33604 TaxID=933084 RepID=A0A067Q6Y1_9AGAM|nr:hypothetical protein JAAARDRAFT_469889 [Jaapia argillacea MUCL 33604]